MQAFGLLGNQNDSSLALHCKISNETSYNIRLKLKTNRIEK